MIEVTQAWQIVQQFAWKSDREEIDLDDALGRRLAEDIRADRDFPPFDRVMMDGYAFLHEKQGAGQKTFRLEQTAYAGEPAAQLVDSSSCIAVMTGAPLPVGCDTVIPIELTSKVEDRIAFHTELPLGKHVHPKGSDQPLGAVLLRTGDAVDVGAIGILATVGKGRLMVEGLPRVTIVSTGDELVDTTSTPAAHQIRRSNDAVLFAMCKALHLPARRVHLSDNRDELMHGLREALEKSDAVLISGGVSMGERDLVPGILDELGAQVHFHRVAQRPGKPLWFGTREECRIFAFPGNPVSATLCATRYFVPWVLGTRPSSAILDEAVAFKPPLTRFLPVKCTVESGSRFARPVQGNGSGDLAALAGATGLLELPSSTDTFEVGSVHAYYPFPHG